MTFGQKLSSLRKRNGLTQEDLAEKLGVSRQAVARWEAEETSPDIKTLAGICRIFGVSADYMIDNGVSESYNQPGRAGNQPGQTCAENATAKSIQPERGPALLWIAAIAFFATAVVGIGIVIDRYSFNLAILGAVWTILSVMGMIIAIKKYYKK